MGRIIIIGSGLAGLSAAIELAKKDKACVLVSLTGSERAQSVLAEGGINAALDTMGENDDVTEHFNDTMRGGAFLADPNAVEGLTENAPGIVRELIAWGVPFNMKDKEPLLRPFGGQKHRRTAFAQSSTGKQIMTSVIDAARRYEAKGLITRMAHHELADIIIKEGVCRGAVIRDSYSGKCLSLKGSVIVCTGGLAGFFPAKTTGTTVNSGAAASLLFSKGVAFSNLEMIQFHPTTIGISKKRLLVSEAARGEGGRLYIERGGEKWYFMEEKYPELGNLMPRDVVSREMFFARRREDCGEQVYLDLTGLSEEVWKSRLSDLREEIISYLSIDPKSTPVPVEEGIHYFMGGIDVDVSHHTNIKGLYAAGECCSQYHGANRLGGNSMLGAIYGGKVAAAAAMNDGLGETYSEQPCEIEYNKAPDRFSIEMSEILLAGLGIVRSGEGISAALEKLRTLECPNSACEAKMHLAEAMLLSALERRESRGAHYREDFPDRDEELRKTIVARYDNGEVRTELREIPERRSV
ncbi:MAG: FAD-binding protein [Ruminococcus sp.]|nr:FAD-binding protein [Ruminococcus sp.]